MTDTAAGRDHGGGVDAACARWGGNREDWLDLSTGINPIAYPLTNLSPSHWQTLPDKAAQQNLIDAARQFWRVPDGLDILPAAGASALISRIPSLAPAAQVSIPVPTYNEHAAAFSASGWSVLPEPQQTAATVVVHPNNPDGRLWRQAELPQDGLTIIDESFCDVSPEHSLLPHAAQHPEMLILKSFGKFWGLAGLRLGFLIAHPHITQKMADLIGPWAVSGPALHIGATALCDHDWAKETRTRLATDALRLDGCLARTDARIVGGTSLFRLYDTPDALALQDRLAQAHIWSRIFPYSDRWVRLGLPGQEADWQRLEDALR